MTHDLENKLETFGDRTSSFITSYPGFESFHEPRLNAEVRFMRAKKAWVAATEPLAPEGEKRSLALKAFHHEAVAHSSRAVFFPISEKLAKDLSEVGADTLAIGAEPIFDLRTLHENGAHPLDRFPRLKGALAAGRIQIQELPADALEPHRARMEEIEAEWLSTRRTRELGFLSRIEPFFGARRKRYFAAFVNGRIEAFLTAVPVKPWGLRWYFAEALRSPSARTGLMEILYLQSMHLLYEQGAREVRLGMVPLAKIDESQDSRARWMVRIAQHLQFIYNFETMQLFKEKLGPQRWETLYVSSFNRLGPWAAWAALQVHLGQRPLRALLWTRIATFLRPYFLGHTRPRLLQPQLATITGGSTLLFLSLHLAFRVMAHQHPEAEALFQAAAYRPEAVSAFSALMSPLLHTTTYHFLGNLLSLLFFGSIVEALLPRWTFALVFSAGLWLSNPLTQTLLQPWLPAFDPTGYAHFIAEWDYGMSNGVYALVGAFAAFLIRPSLVLIPFIANAVFLIFALNSWLSVHHLMGLFLGFTLTRITFFSSAKRAARYAQRRARRAFAFAPRSD